MSFVDILFLAVAVLTSGLSGMAYRTVSQHTSGYTASALVPALWYLPLSLVFFLIAAIGGTLHPEADALPSVLCGGISAFVCAFSLLESMRRNSFAIAVIIVNLSFVFPVVFSAIYPGEPVGIFQLIGMLVAVAAILLLNIKKGTAFRDSLSAILFAVLSSLGNGLLDYALKIRQYTVPGLSDGMFFAAVYGLAALLSLLTGGLLALLRGRPGMGSSDIRPLLIGGGLIALSNGLCFFALARLTGAMNAAAEFTVITALTIVLSLAYEAVRSRKMPVPKEWVCVILCAAAIVFQYLNLSG